MGKRNRKRGKRNPNMTFETKATKNGQQDKSLAKILLATALVKLAQTIVEFIRDLLE